LKRQRSKGRAPPVASVAASRLRDEYARSLDPARKLAAEAMKLEHEISDLVNAAYGLTPDEIALLWATAPPRMPISKLASSVSSDGD
jgi:hypothetical protein